MQTGAPHSEALINIWRASMSRNERPVICQKRGKISNINEDKLEQLISSHHVRNPSLYSLATGYPVPLIHVSTALTLHFKVIILRIIHHV